MTTTTSKSLALLAAALLCAPSAFAQAKPEPKPAPAKAAAPAVPTPPAPPSPSVAPALSVRPTTVGFSTIAPVAPPAPAAPRRLKVLQVPFSELESAVDLLQHALEDNGLEQMNILFGPDTKDLEVSAVTLRNVTGPDALQLIAASAGCTVEPMFSSEKITPLQANPPGAGLPVIIGYQLRGKAKPVAPPQPPSVLPPAGTPRMLTLAGRASAANSSTGRLTHIYPLGNVTTATKFPDLEKTLREIFKADGVAENQVSLALHEKTNVLVVNAAEPVHALVEQLLTALNTNTSQADRQNTARDRAMGREELESAMRTKARLEHELAERDALMRELQKELRKLQDAVQKPPSAK